MKHLSLLMCTILIVQSLSAQVVSYDMIQRYRNTNVKLTLRDAKTSEPISWASVYLVPENDTTITHFALSDDKGDVLLKEVPVGKYELNAEMIGYNPHKKVYNIKSHWDAFDLGIVKMYENPEFLDAASISAIGNPIVVKKDTIEFNASSFRVGENDMLEDLLKKMPGMTVSEDGSVTLNGEKIEKITVGGKTFFFNDPNAALKSLPAKIVEKIKVVDKTKNEAAGAGIVTKDDKEKVMDVELKEEYTEGWYGNVKAGAGSTLTPEDGSKLVDDRKMLYNGNAMVTGYTEKDQVVMIGNAFNAIEPGSSVNQVIRYGSSLSDFSSLGGLNSSAQAGINYNTSRIKGMNTALNINYRNNGKIAAQESSRTTFQPESADILTESSYQGTGNQNNLAASFEIQSEDNKDYHFYFSPTVGYVNEEINTSENSMTSNSDNEPVNTSESSTTATSGKIYSTASLFAGLMNMGKKNRNISIGAEYDFYDTDKKSYENAIVNAADMASVRNLFYKTDMQNLSTGIRMRYSEPISERWTAGLTILSRYYLNKDIRNATNPDGTYNDYYSSSSESRYLNEVGYLTVQYSNDTTKIQFGLTADATQNEIRSKTLGVETITGKGEWLSDWAPFASLEYEKDNTGLYMSYTGVSRQPSGSSLTPSLNISNPVQISAGNIYLKPSYMHYLSASLSRSNREIFSFLNLYLSGSVTARETVHASWTDQSGIRYSIPVNSRKPQSSGYFYASYNRPIGKEKKFTVTASGNVIYTGNYSYQAKKSLPGLDLQNFDYNRFMEEFWGNAAGDRFYSGESGFGESRTNSLNWSATLQMKYSIDKFDATITATTSNKISRYSLDPTANMNTWDSVIKTNILYQPGKDWEIGTDFGYHFFNGYSLGFGAPEWRWNARVSKSFKAVTLSLKAVDILNQTRSLRRTISAEYVEDVYTNVLGRFFLFSVSFNFGKMNAKKNRNVEAAVWNMM